VSEARSTILAMLIAAVVGALAYTGLPVGEWLRGWLA